MGKWDEVFRGLRQSRELSHLYAQADGFMGCEKGVKCHSQEAGETARQRRQWLTLEGGFRCADTETSLLDIVLKVGCERQRGV